MQQPLEETAGAEPAAEDARTAAPRRGFAMGLMVLSSIVISFGGLIVRSIHAADPWQINFYRSLGLITAVAAILIFNHRGRTVTQIRGIGGVGILGGVMLSGAGVCFLQALTHTSVANTLFILSAIPFFTAALARVFLGEHLQRPTVLTMVFAAAGILIMLREGFAVGSIFGNLMALVTAFCFASFAVIVRRKRRTDMMPTLLVSGSLIAVVAFCVRFGDLTITLHDLLLCLLWGGVLSGFANWMFIIAARHLQAAEVTLFMLLEFALGPLWVWLFVAETPSTSTLAGGTLVITSVAVRALLELRRAGTAPA